jgi:DNA-binding NtrC family response regulator
MLKLLVVDDEAGIREGLALSLGDLFDVTEAADGQSALKAIAEGHPDLVILDQNMEGLSGSRVLEQIHNLDKHVPVVMLSASMDVPLAMSSLRLGAQDCVSKPFSVKQLKATLFQALGRRPGSDLTEGPFALQVAQLIRAPVSGSCQLDDSRTSFILSLLQAALENAGGNLDIAADRLGLGKEEMKELWKSYGQEGRANDGITAAGR